jgi:hypothetical protein
LGTLIELLVKDKAMKEYIEPLLFNEVFREINS